MLQYIGSLDRAFKPAKMLAHEKRGERGWAP